jgi:terminase small subunit / prophage DNA-packing protein
VLFNRTEMADCVGISPGTLDNWVRQGCPVVERPGQGRAATFKSEDVFAWHVAREIRKAVEKALADAEKHATAEDLDALRAEGMRLKNEGLRLDLAMRAGELVPVRDVSRGMCGLVIGGRAHVLNVAPPRIATRAAVPGALSLRQIAHEEIAAALEQWRAKPIADLIADCGGDPELVRGVAEAEAQYKGGEE